MTSPGHYCFSQGGLNLAQQIESDWNRPVCFNECVYGVRCGTIIISFYSAPAIMESLDTLELSLKDRREEEKEDSRREG